MIIVPQESAPAPGTCLMCGAEWQAVRPRAPRVRRAAQRRITRSLWRVRCRGAQAPAPGQARTCFAPSGRPHVARCERLAAGHCSGSGEPTSPSRRVPRRRAERPKKGRGLGTAVTTRPAHRKPRPWARQTARHSKRRTGPGRDAQEETHEAGYPQIGSGSLTWPGSRCRRGLRPRGPLARRLPDQPDETATVIGAAGRKPWGVSGPRPADAPPGRPPVGGPPPWGHRVLTRFPAFSPGARAVHANDQSGVAV